MTVKGAGLWRAQFYEVIFETNTPAGRAFDVGLFLCILLSVGAVMLDSITSVSELYGFQLRFAEWFFTLLFTIEYGLRVVVAKKPASYVLSFFGCVDLLAIVPTFASIFFTGSQSLSVIRALRLLRVFRVLKLVRFTDEARDLQRAISASSRKIVVFLGTVLILLVIIGALMYWIEGELNGFTSIPQSIYWAIVTMTTVGYGDIAPQTILGKFLASCVMILGFGIITVTTGVVTVDLVQSAKPARGTLSQQSCRQCLANGHDLDAKYCKYCGTKL